MEITKPNDIFVASLNNPESTTYDLMSADLTPDNTSFYKKEDYLQSKFVQDKFKTPDGQFDSSGFDLAFNKAASHYKEMTDENFLDNLGKAVYSPFDITRPLESKTFTPEVEFKLDFNPFKYLYSRSGINSVDENPLSVRELAQQNKVYDPDTKTWSNESANDLGILTKFFGDTLVYGQWDEDGMHKDPETNRMVNHKKGEWKYDDNGNLFLEKLGNREIYGRQVVSPMDLLTTDGSLANQFDFLDSDSRDKSIMGTTAKMIFEIAPFFIPVAGVAEVYGGLKAAVSLGSILPTFYKAFEGMLLGDTKTPLNDAATAAESYMSKFNQQSVSDQGSNSFFNYEQLSQMVGSVFSQIYEQRAAASLSMLIKKPAMNKISAKGEELLKTIDDELTGDLIDNKLSVDDFLKIRQNAINKIPELAAEMDSQSKLSKALSLGYMSMLQSADVYSQALAGGYDRRTAGFAALSAAAGQYGIMANNRMGDWFLDKTTGYSLGTNQALMRKSILPFLDDVKDGLTEVAKDASVGKASLAGTFGKIKDALHNTFMTPAVLGEAMWKNSVVEGVEEVTEQAVLDATKGVVDILSYLGLTKNQGSMGGFSTVFSQAGLENYLANFVGGLIGGSMFEFQQSRIDPWIHHQLPTDTKEDIYDLIANGKKDDIIKIINEHKSSWGNTYISPIKDDGTFDIADSGTLSSADIIAGRAINMVESIDGLLNSQDLGSSDEEVVRKALRDDILIQQLRADKKASGTGLEGLILEEYKSYRGKILDLSSKINSLNGKAGEKVDENSEEVQRLSQERDSYKLIVQDILEGNQAERYFGEAAWYLSKPISSDFVAIDKESFVEAKYNTPYNNLPDKGTMSLSKERVDKEFADYVANKDLRQYLDLGYKAYLNLEQKFNPILGEHVASGYIDESAKTWKNLLNLAITQDLFDTKDGESSVPKVQRFLQQAKQIEEKTGNRVLPWEAINSQMSQTLMGTKAFTMEDEDGVIQFGDQVIKKKELVAKVLESIIDSLPPEQLNYDTISKLFSDQIERENGEIREQNDAAFNPLVTEFNSITIDGAESDPNKYARKEELFKEINKRQLVAKLVPYEELEEFKKNFNDSVQQLQESHIATEGLSTDILDRFISMPGKVTALPSVTEQTPIDELVRYASTLGVNADLPKITEDLTNVVNNANISDEEKKAILAGDEYTGTNPDIINALETFNTSLDNVVNLLNGEIKRYNQDANTYNNFQSATNELKQELLANQPSIFGTTDALLPALIGELKNNKNLDGELLILAKKVVSGYLKPIKALSSTFSLSDADILKLASLSNSELQSILSGLRQMVSESQSENPDFIDGFWQYAGAIGENLPEGIKRAIDSIASANPSQQEYLLSNITGLRQVVSKILNNGNALKPVLELNQLTANDKMFKQNSVYNFIRKFDVFLDRDSKLTVGKIWDILESEEAKLAESSTLDSYFSSGYKTSDLTTSINTIKMLESIVRGASSTQLTYADPIGFIAARQSFAARNKIESDVKDLVSITSDQAALIIKELERVRIKLQFLKDLSKYNSGLLAKEQILIKTKFNKLLINNWSELIKKNLTYKDKAIIPNITDTLSSDLSDEEKLLTIENSFYENVKEYSIQDKVAIGKILSNLFSFDNRIESIYSSNGQDEITKDIKAVSNNDMLLYLLGTMSVKSSDFNIKMLNALKTTFDKAPFFTQELGIKIMYASTINPELFSEILQELSPIQKTDEIDGVWAYDTTLITYILGNAGTGKTTVMYKLYLAMMSQSNSHLDVWFSGPEIEQATKLENDVLSGLDKTKYTTNTLSKDQLFARLGLKDVIDNIKKDENTDIERNTEGATLKSNYEDHLFFKSTPEFDIPTDLPEIIFIDEISHYTALEQSLINEVSKRAMANDGKVVKIFAAGDTLQKGVDFNGINYNVGRVSGIFAPSLFLTIRAQNNQKRDNNDIVSTTIRNISRIWLDSQKSTQSVFENFLKDGITLKYFQSANVFNGDKVVEGAVPMDALLSIAKAIKENPQRTIGILTDSSGVISDDLKIKLDKAGIFEPSYIAVTPKKVQGREFDYFVFNLSAAKEKSIFDSLKAFYTYLSRAKYGSIIVRDADIDFGQRLELHQKTDSYTDELNPLDATMVTELKAARIKELEKLLGTTTTLDNDYLFNRKADVGSVSPEDMLMSTDDRIDVTDSLNNDIQDTVLKFSLTRFSESHKGSQNVMVHTFYNDMSVISSLNGDKATIARGASKFSYGLDYLLKNQRASKVTMPKADYDKAVNLLIKAKYQILKNKVIDIKTVQEIFANPLLTLSDVLPKGQDGKTTSGFVITADLYHEASNKPVALKYDDASKHLPDKSKYLNLMYRLINPTTGEDFFVHLGTFPDLENLKNVIGSVFANSPTNQRVLETYETLMNDLEIGKYVEINNPKTVVNITSTRMWPPVNGKKLQTSLKELTETPGLLFYDSNFKVVNDPVINFFPKDFEKYKTLFKSTLFGKSFEGWNDADKVDFEDRLKKSYEQRAGRPYITASYMDDTGVGPNDRTIRFITMHSTTRTWKEIDKIVNGTSDTPSLTKRIFDARKTSETVQGKKALDEVYALSGSLFSGNDVLDLLISLATEKVELFDKLLNDGNSWLTDVMGNRDDSAQKILKALFANAHKDASKTILDAITYSNKGAQKVYESVRDYVKTHPKPTNVSPEESAKYRTEFKSYVINTVARQKEGRYWFKAFWNIFKLQNALEAKIQENGIGVDLDKQYFSVINDVVNYWKGLKDSIYYNIPILTKNEGTELVGDTFHPSILDNLYTTLSPEGPRILVDLRDKVKLGAESSIDKLDFLNNPSNISEGEYLEVAKALNLQPSTTALPITVRNLIANSGVSIDEIKKAIKILRSKSPEQQEKIATTFELNQIVFNKKPIFTAEASDNIDQLKVKVVRAQLVKSALKLAEWKGKIDLLKTKSVAELNVILGNSKPESVWTGKLKQLDFTPGSIQDLVRNRITLMLDGKMDEGDSFDPKVQEEITAILEILTQNKIDINTLFTTGDIPENFANFRDKVMAIDPNNEAWDNIEKLWTC